MEDEFQPEPYDLASDPEEQRLIISVLDSFRYLQAQIARPLCSSHWRDDMHPLHTYFLYI